MLKYATFANFCQDEHSSVPVPLPPLAAAAKLRDRQENYMCLSVSAPHCAWKRWHLIIALMSPWLNLWTRALPVDALQTPQGTFQASPLAPRTQKLASHLFRFSGWTGLSKPVRSCS